MIAAGVVLVTLPAAIALERSAPDAGPPLTRHEPPAATSGSPGSRRRAGSAP
jgi:hypothetical protein